MMDDVAFLSDMDGVLIDSRAKELKAWRTWAEVARICCTWDEIERTVHAAQGQACLTGLWQVSGRSALSWSESVRLDIRYVENWSLTLDLAIVWKQYVQYSADRALTNRLMLDRLLGAHGPPRRSSRRRTVPASR